jgi:hypothetical protein
MMTLCCCRMISPDNSANSYCTKYSALIHETWWDSVHLVRRPLICLLLQPRMIDDDECGAVGWMRIGRGNRSIQIKSAQVPLRPPQIPHDLTWARTRPAAVGSRRLTAWAMARPVHQTWGSHHRETSGRRTKWAQSRPTPRNKKAYH